MIAHKSSRNRWSSLIDTVSFSGSVRELVDILNREIESPDKVQVRLRSHPAGYAKEITKRRLTIAESYLRLVTTSGVEGYQTRLDALETLVYQASHSKALSLPINTARVQAALMKECVKSRGKLRRQLELMSDFAVASHGQPNVIRRLLRELDLVEVPDDGRPLSELDLGWDDHVHDFLTEGRKTPSQLLLDAFIQGISRLTVAYYDVADSRVFEEAIEAGRILGIRVSIGVEFSVGLRHARQHFMFIPPGSETADGLRQFLMARREELAPFFEGLNANAVRRKQVISELIEHFNATELRQLNARYRNQPFLQLSPLRWEDLEAVMHGGQASRIHLGQLLCDRLKPILHKRVLYLKNQFHHVGDKLRNGETSSWEVENMRAQYLEARTEYENCNAESLRDRFATSREGVDYDSAFVEPEAILRRLADCGGEVVFIHPLSQGIDAALRTLLRCHRSINAIETFNLADSSQRDPADLRRLNHAVELLNRGAGAELGRLLDEWSIPDVDREQTATAATWYGAHPLIPRCGTDYVGRDARVPGMGFVRSDVVGRSQAHGLVKRQHLSLVVPIGRLLLQCGRSDEPVEEKARVLVLASPSAPWHNVVGDEPEVERIRPLRFWRYLNPSLKSFIKTAIGFVPAYLVVGPWYALLWLAITASRNAIVDMIAATGHHVRSWHWSVVDRENLANSLFYTGFSVPILGAAKYGFDIAWAALSGDPGLAMKVVKFCVLSVTNGLYLASHNTLRGFDRGVVRGNFFRSVLSWPLATAGSYLFDLVGVPAIVQTKFWSDVVAGVIEGSGKVARRMRLSQRNLLELLRSIAQGDRQSRLVAMADLLFVWSRRHQGKAALARIFSGRFKTNLLDANGHPMVADRAMVDEARAKLIEAFGADGSMESLTTLLLTHYSGREAVLLTDLVADNHLEFLRWLRRYGPTRSAAAAAGEAALEPVAPGK
ncbi:MAG: hypothetical protein JXR83_13635 [Deltaproteobacteria bacterium]|nr:hypothetical protein [Deltaproteobacteria bacterium]